MADGDKITEPVFYGVDEWIEENKKWFLPPVCNKMMHKVGQMKLFFVGGPNQRKDFHIDAGEELFLQLKGDMVLKVVEKNVHRDVRIKEGEMFLLPGRIPHSPQRFDDTVGLVIERDRHPDTENDGLRYFTEKEGKFTLDPLYEKWFFCEDLGVQLGPIIKTFFASEQYKTGVPDPAQLATSYPYPLDMERSLENPFSFDQWIDNNAEQIERDGCKQVFDGTKYQFQVWVYGAGEKSDLTNVAETWIWQWRGESKVTIGEKVYQMKKKDSLLVPIGDKFTVAQESGSFTLVCYQDPTKATTWPKEQ